MPLLNIYVDEATDKRLKKLSQEWNRSGKDLAECAVAEAALDAFRYRKDDPAQN